MVLIFWLSRHRNAEKCLNQKPNNHLQVSFLVKWVRFEGISFGVCLGASHVHRGCNDIIVMLNEQQEEEAETRRGETVGPEIFLLLSSFIYSGNYHFPTISCSLQHLVTSCNMLHQSPKTSELTYENKKKCDATKAALKAYITLRLIL